MLGAPKSGNGLAFARLYRFCDAFGIDPAEIGRRSVVVTGTNGKGSTARFAAALLGTAYPRVGCFTSPHLFDVTERFDIGGATIARDDYDRLAAVAQDFDRQLRDQGDFCGAFELLFMIALLWFREQNADAIVWEAGIGGRYDPVRLLSAPLSVLTSIDLEHTELLGRTEELIALDKLDATGPGGTTIVSSSVPARLAPRLRAFARAAGKTLVFVDDAADIRGVTVTATGTTFDLVPFGADPIPLRLGLPGTHQAANAATAWLAAERFLNTRGVSFPRGIEPPALAAVRWPGRLERISDDPLILVDVGHTPEAIAVVADAVAAMVDPERVLVVAGVSKTKSVEAILDILSARFRHFIATSAHKNGAPAGDIAAHLKADDVTVAETIEDAVHLAVHRARRTGETIAVLGGLFLATEFAHAFRGGDPKTLEFF